MPKNAIHLEVITPERQVLRTEAEAVVIPAHDGELGILHNRAPLMCELGIGRLRYEDNGVEKGVFIDGGFAQVNADVVTVLTPQAYKSEDVTKELIAQAEQVAEAESDGTLRSQAQQRVSAMRSVSRYRVA